MGGGFVSCGGCDRLVKTEDASCPFCGARMVASARPSSDACPRARTSRAGWMAFGPATLLGAVVTSATCAVVASACAPNLTDTQDPEASADATAAEAGDAHARDAARVFTCGDGVCPWPATLCREAHAVDCRYNCSDFPPPPPCGHGSGRQSVTYQCEPFTMPPECQDTPTCGCVINSKFPDAASDDAYCLGGLFALSYAYQTGCGGCYGCPPARLERLVS